MTYTDVQKELRSIADADIAGHSARFFKTGKGEYGEGDLFLGIRVPDLREIARRHKELPLAQVTELLHSDYHEERLTALFILVLRFQKGHSLVKREVFERYMANRDQVNNWDLVDSSAPKIVGPWLMERDRSILYKLAESDSVWDRRIAILSTLFFIKKGDFKDALSLSEKMLNDKHDLIHKATGWMLREVGNMDRKTEETFLDKYCGVMPRTMLRYAIEKFSKEERQKYLNTG